MTKSTPRIERIIEYAPPYIPVPAVKYGGSERVVGNIMQGWSNKGDDLPFLAELWAPGDSTIKQSSRVTLHPTIDKALGFGKPFEANRILYRDHALIKQLLLQNPNTVAHFHTEDLHTLTFGSDKNLIPRVISTVHNLPKDWHYDYAAMPLVAISHAQKNRIGQGFDFVEVIYNAVNEELFEPNFEIGPESYSSFVGRFSPNKAPLEAAQISSDANIPIKIAGIKDPDEEEYYQQLNQFRESHSGEFIQFVGEVSDEIDQTNAISSKCSLLRNSRALLFPIKWAEPFGLVIAEANACGTPVIAYDYPGSSVDELIINGVNGFKVKNKEEATQALNKVETIDRKAVHQHYKDNFTTLVMAEKYQNLFENQLPEYWKEIGYNPAKGLRR